jgi:hypothetical protein
MKFLNCDYFDRGATQRRHVRAIGIRVIGKEANQWEEHFFPGSFRGCTDRLSAGPHERGAISGGIASGCFRPPHAADFRGFWNRPKFAQSFAWGQVAVTPVMVADPGDGPLDQVASGQAEFERTVRDELLAEINQRRLRRVAKSLSVDASNIRKMVAGKRRLKAIV